MKSLDVPAAVLLIVGGLNRVLFGAFRFDPVAAVLGRYSAISWAVYLLVGLAAVDQALAVRAMPQR